MSESGEKAEARGPGGPDVRKVRLAVASLLAVAGVVILAIVLLGGSGDDSSSAGEGESEAVALSESELLAEASGLGGPAYWIGPRAGTESYELTSTEDGRIYIRYLTGDAEAGDERADFLSVGTYPFPDAEAGLQRSAAKGEGTLEQGNDYTYLVPAAGENAYVVFDDEPDLQIEVFSPQSGEAEQLARDDALEPLG
jgi:hypothetical protein